MMNVAANMEIQMSGNASPNSSISYPSPQLSKINSSASTEDSLPVSKPSTTFAPSKDSKKYHTKDPCATSSGLTPMTEQVGE